MPGFGSEWDTLYISKSASLELSAFFWFLAHVIQINALNMERI